MCTGIEPVVVASLIGAGATVGTTLLAKSGSKKQSLPQLPDPTPLPDPEAIQAKAREDARRRAQSKTKTILTSGAGVISEPIIQKKKILGG